jgi:hypothetical protein
MQTMKSARAFPSVSHSHAHPHARNYTLHDRSRDRSVNTVYKRYTTLYYLARAVERSVHMITSLACTFIDKEAQRFSVCRFALATAMITFMRAVPDPGQDTASPTIAEWQWERMMHSERMWLEKRTTDAHEQAKPRTRRRDRRP